MGLISAVGFVTQGELMRSLGGVVATSSLLGVPLGHHSSFHEGSAFAPPRIREAIWCDSTNSTTEEGKQYCFPLSCISSSILTNNLSCIQKNHKCRPMILDFNYKKIV